MKYRKKSIVIEALRWDGTNHREMFEFLGGSSCGHMTEDGAHFYIYNKVNGDLVIKTLEGEHLANIGDWVIKGVQGEYYPCKPDIFAQTYEEVTP